MWRAFQKKHNIDENIINCIEKDFIFESITKVQNVVIPQFIKNKDVIVKSCTGSGKTLSYLIPMFQKLINYTNSCPEDSDLNDKILSIIMLPSRELSIQVFNVFLKFIQSFKEKFKFSYALFIGGKKLSIDLDKLSVETPNIIIATPGRLFELDEKLHPSFKDLQILILDEADKMLELGYENKVACLLDKLPKQRRTGLFSATMNSQIENLIKVGMRNPVFIDIKINFEAGHSKSGSKITSNEQIFINSEELNYDYQKNKCESDNSYFSIIDLDSTKDMLNKKDELSLLTQETPIQLKQYFHIFENIKNKFSSMVDLIKKRSENQKMMIFFATCNTVDYFSIVLPILFKNENENGINIDTKVNFFKLHSKISQKKRKKEYKNFLSASSGILLTTDLSARGIDVPNIDLILQYDPPKNEELYIHRVGRTARVGSEGMSILFLAKNEEYFIKYMKQKNIFINPFDINLITNEQSDVFFSILKDINKTDKWIYDKAVKAFVAFMRFYIEHDLKYIFDFNLLDIGNIANSFGLFRLPRIKEILGRKIENFTQDETVQPKNFVYLDSNIAKQMEAKDEKIKKSQEERRIKKEIEILSKKTEKKNRSRKDKREAKYRSTQKDWDDLAEDERLYKKFKKGKISKEEYNKLMMKNI